MTLDDILGPLALDLTSSQRAEVEQAILEDAAGVRKLVASIRRSTTVKAPVGALIGSIRKDRHLSGRPEKPTMLEVAMALHVARNAAYPPTGEKGWTADDAITYAVDTTVQIHGCNQRELEAELRAALGLPSSSQVASPDERRRWISVQRRLVTSQEASDELQRLLDLGTPSAAILAELEAILGPDPKLSSINPNEPVGTTLLPTIDAAIAKTARAVAEEEDDLAALFRGAA